VLVLIKLSSTEHRFVKEHRMAKVFTSNPKQLKRSDYVSWLNYQPESAYFKQNTWRRPTNYEALHSEYVPYWHHEKLYERQDFTYYHLVRT